MRRFVIGFMVLLLPVACHEQGAAPVDAGVGVSAAAVNTYYTCSMHPQVMQEKPGECPICGMKLIGVQKSAAQERTEIRLSAQQMQLGNVHTEVVTDGSIGDRLVLAATLNFDQQHTAAIGARVAGRIERLYFKNTGDYVRKGDALFDVYSESLNNAQQEYLLALAQQRAVPDNELVAGSQLGESARRKLLLWGMTEGQVEILARMGRRADVTTMYSTAEGYVTSLDVKEGDYVTEGGNVVRLADLSSLWAEAQVYTSQLAELDNEGIATVQLPDLGNLEVRGKLAFVNPEINPDTRINLIRVAIPNLGMQLKPGMPAYVTVRSRVHKGIVLPIDAVIRDGKTAVVWVKTGANTFSSRTVTTGIETGNSIEIVRGLAIGDTVVVTGAYLVNSEFVFKKGGEPGM